MQGNRGIPRIENVRKNPSRQSMECGECDRSNANENESCRNEPNNLFCQIHSTCDRDLRFFMIAKILIRESRAFVRTHGSDLILDFLHIPLLGLNTIGGKKVRWHGCVYRIGSQSAVAVFRNLRAIQLCLSKFVQRNSPFHQYLKADFPPRWKDRNIWDNQEYW